MFGQHFLPLLSAHRFDRTPVFLPQATASESQSDCNKLVGWSPRPGRKVHELSPNVQSLLGVHENTEQLPVTLHNRANLGVTIISLIVTPVSLAAQTTRVCGMAIQFVMTARTVYGNGSLACYYFGQRIYSIRVSSPGEHGLRG